MSNEGLDAQYQRKLAAEPHITRRFRRRMPLVGVPLQQNPLGDTLITEGDATEDTRVREGLYRRSLALADAVAAGVVILALLPQLASDTPALVAIPAMALLIFINKVRGLYERDDVVIKKTTLDEAPSLLQAAGLFTLGVWLFHDGLTLAELDASDVTVVLFASFCLLLIGRVVARWIARHLAATERCLIIGDSSSIAAVEVKLNAARLNVVVVASLSMADSDLRSATELLDLFRGLVRRHDVHRVIIAPAQGGGSEILDLIRAAKHAGVRVSVLPRMLEVIGSSVEFDHLDGMTMLGVRRFGLTRTSKALKRAFDLVGSSALLIAAAPIFLLAMLAIRVDSRGPVFFGQTRVGRDGKRFQMLKFRSMVPEAEALKEELRHLNETEGLFKLSEDPRVTRAGWILRRSSLDELPQLINVWRGEMSLVGPRPLVVDEDEQVEGFDRHRLHLTPGMTGHWQIMGSARIPMREMVGIDYLYVANWSLWTDVKILLRTIPYVLSSRGL